MTQCDAVLMYLQDHKLITARQAASKLGVDRLAAMVNDLRRDGHKIVSDSRMVKTRYGKTRVAVYRLEES